MLLIKYVAGEAKDVYNYKTVYNLQLFLFQTRSDVFCLMKVHTSSQMYLQTT